MNIRMLAKYWRTILVVAEMNFRQQMTDGFILFTTKCTPKGLRYRRLGKIRLDNGVAPRSEQYSKNALRAHSFAAPWNDGERSFSTKERLAVWAKEGETFRITKQKTHFVPIPGTVLRTHC